MKKKNNKKGFTLAELLIVVAIIAVLTAIAIPVFTTQLEKSREATDVANIRDAYAEISVGMLDGELEEADDTMKLSGNLDATLSAAPTSASFSVTVADMPIHQKDYDSWAMGTPEIAGIEVSALPSADTSDVVFNFTTPTDGNAYLSSINFGA